MQRHIAESKKRFEPRAAALNARKVEMTERHRGQRDALDARQDAERIRDTKARAERLPRGVSGLWHRLTGRYQDTKRQIEAEARAQQSAQRAEWQALIDAQLRKREALQSDIKDLRQAQAEQLRTLRREVGRYLSFQRDKDPGLQSARGADAALGLQLTRR